MALLNCKKDKDSDKIKYYKVNKTLTGVSKDSVNITTCYPTIFEIKLKPNPTINGEVEALLRYPNIILQSVCGILYLADQSGNVNVLSKNDNISSSGSWNYITNSFSLINFNNIGEKYIGFRCTINPNGYQYFQYGWIKVDLNINSKTLSIIDYAINETYNKSIIVGQKE